MIPDTFVSAIEVFVKGYCVGKSMTHPYESNFMDGIWQLRDAPRKKSGDFRKEEYVAASKEPKTIHQLARESTRGWYFISDLVPEGQEADARRREFKKLGYRLLSTEPFFQHPLKRIPSAKNKRVKIELLKDKNLAAMLGKAMRMRPLPETCFGTSGLFRQYIAVLDDGIVGWVRSVPAGKSTWCSTLGVRPSLRRQGIGQTLLARMLRDDRKLGFQTSVLLASHTGALVYPKLGYEQIGTLYIYAPHKK